MFDGETGDQLSPNENEISAKLAAGEEKLAKLDRDREGIKQSISELRAQLARPDNQSPFSTISQDFEHKFPSTTKEKVGLFRSLFRGRVDVFPKRWENIKKGTAGLNRPGFSGDLFT